MRVVEGDSARHGGFESSGARTSERAEREASFGERRDAPSVSHRDGGRSQWNGARERVESDAGWGDERESARASERRGEATRERARERIDEKGEEGAGMDDWMRSPAIDGRRRNDANVARSSENTRRWSPRRSPERARRNESARATDWECGTCDAHNYARRSACFKCGAERGDDAKVVPHVEGQRDRDVKPSTTLWVKNIPEDATEEQLAHKIGSAFDGDMSFIRSIKMPREYGSDRRKGYAFVNCLTVEHAVRVKSAIDSAPFRDDWVGGVMSCEFSVSEVSQSQAVKDLKSSELNALAQNAILQATAASAMTTNEHASQNNEYVYDEATGYYKHKVTGVFYDPNSGLFYNHQTSAWYSWNETTREYTVVGAAAPSTGDSHRADASTKSAPTERSKSSQTRVARAVISAAPVPRDPALDVAKEARDTKSELTYRDRASERRALEAKVLGVAGKVVAGKITGGRLRAPKS